MTAAWSGETRSGKAQVNPRSASKCPECSLRMHGDQLESGASAWIDGIRADYHVVPGDCGHAEPVCNAGSCRRSEDDHFVGSIVCSR